MSQDQAVESVPSEPREVARISHDVLLRIVGTALLLPSGHYTTCPQKDGYLLIRQHESAEAAEAWVKRKNEEARPSSTPEVAEPRGPAPTVGSDEWQAKVADEQRKGFHTCALSSRIRGEGLIPCAACLKLRIAELEALVAERDSEITLLRARIAEAKKFKDRYYAQARALREAPGARHPDPITNAAELACLGRLEELEQAEATIDPRPACLKCGQRWVPREGEDATSVPCDSCEPDPNLSVPAASPAVVGAPDIERALGILQRIRNNAMGGAHGFHKEDAEEAIQALGGEPPPAPERGKAGSHE